MTDEKRYREVEREVWRRVGLEPTEQRIKIGGVGVRVQIVGEGPPVVFIHGSPNAGTTWAVLLQHLKGFRRYVVDRPGTGLSDDFVLGNDPHGHARRFVPEVLDGLELERSHLVASSFGGFIALMSAAAAPERVNRMVQMGCPAFVPGMKVPGFMKAMAFRPVRWLMNSLPPNEKVGKSILRQIGHGASIDVGRIPQVFFDWYVALQRYTNTMRNDGEMIGRAVSFSGFPPETTIPETVFGSVTTPTLFLWGADDPFGDEAVARRVVSLMPRASLTMFPHFGHLPWLDDPAGIAEATGAFLATE